MNNEPEFIQTINDIGPVIIRRIQIYRENNKYFILFWKYAVTQSL